MFWHWVISKKKKKAKHKCYGEIIKLEAQRKRVIIIKWGFPGSTSGKEPISQCRRRKRRGFDP